MHARGLVSFFPLSLFASLVAAAAGASVNVTVPARHRDVRYTGSQWRCSPTASEGPSSAGTRQSSCDAGCSTTLAGDSIQYSFRGTAVYLTVQQDANADVALQIELDGAQTRYTPFNLVAPGCAGELLGSGLDPEKLHTLNVSVLPGGEGAFVFGGLMVTVPDSSFSGSGPGSGSGATSSFRGPSDSFSSNSNPNSNSTSTATPPPSALTAQAPPRPSRVPVIAGVLSAVLVFWVAGGLALCFYRRRQCRRQSPEHTMVMTIDYRSAEEAAARRHSAASIRPFPVSFPQQPPQPHDHSSFISIGNGTGLSKESLAEAGTLTKWQRELLAERAVARQPDQPVASGSGSGGGTASPPPVYTPRARERAS